MVFLLMPLFFSFRSKKLLLLHQRPSFWVLVLGLVINSLLQIINVDKNESHTWTQSFDKKCILWYWKSTVKISLGTEIVDFEVGLMPYLILKQVHETSLSLHQDYKIMQRKNFCKELSHLARKEASSPCSTEKVLEKLVSDQIKAFLRAKVS